MTREAAISLGADVEDEVAAYLLSERVRIQRRLAMLRSGRAWTSEMGKGEPVDTTAQTLNMLEDHLEEIDRLLSKAGVAHEA